MANSLSIQATVTNTVDNVRNTLSSNATTTTVSSNLIVNSSDVTASVWSNLSLGSCDDVLALTVWNDNTVYTSSVISVSTSSAGLYPLAILNPGAQAIIPWSGSLPGLYAKVIGGYPGNVAAIYWRDGVVQYSAQQS